MLGDIGGALVEHFDNGMDSVEQRGGEVMGLLGSRYMEGALFDLSEVMNDCIIEVL